MLKVRKILHASDFSACSRQALPHALFLARNFGAELHLLHALVPHRERLDVPEDQAPEPEDLMGRLEARAREELGELLGEEEAGAVKLVTAVRRGTYPAPTILRYARGEGIDLVVLGTHGRRAPGRLLLGSVAEEVVRLAPCPVLTLKQCEEPPKPSAVEQILVPVDFSDHSRRALGYARDLADRYAARLQLLHVIEQVVLPSFYIPGAPGIFPHNLSGLEGTAEAELHALMESDGPKVPYEAHVITASPVTGITDFAAEHGSDLLVISTHGLTGLERLLIGSTAESLIRLAPCPVFTVKAFERDPELGEE